MKKTKKQKQRKGKHQAAAATQSEAQRSDAERNEDERGTGKPNARKQLPEPHNRALTASLPKEHVCTVR